MKKSIIKIVLPLLAVALMGVVFATSCEKGDNTVHQQGNGLVGKWKVEYTVRDRISNDGSNEVYSDTFYISNLTLEIAYFHSNGIVYFYSEVNNHGDFYMDIYDWAISDDGRYIILTNGRNNMGMEIGYADRNLELLTIDETKLRIRETNCNDKFSIVQTSEYKRQ